MRSENITTKEGVQLLTKDEKTMQNHFLEAEDVFIPQYNSYSEKSHEATIKGKVKVIVERKIKCKVNGATRDKNGLITGFAPGVDANGSDDIFITLTPTQAKAFDKVKAKGAEPNQTIWKAYSYTNDFGEQVGIGPKVDFKPAIKFEDEE
jgi:hypothetical protein